MIYLKRIFSIILVSSIAFTATVSAQKTNQFDENGKRTGVWKKFYNNNKLRYSGKFKAGKEIGVFKFYNIDSYGTPAIVKEFSSKSDSAFVKFYTPKGKVKSKGWMIGKNREGKWMYYFGNGKVFSEENYKDGKLEGVVRNYYPNGKLTEETYYKEGKKEGSSKVYTDDGILIEEVAYVNGKLHGFGKYFNLKGQLQERGNYENGVRKGKWEFFIDGEVVTKRKRKNLSDLKNK
ncbi:Antitoxin component YwqK of the YwqJK toxin-antitoxin module [Tenacibaculum sp. 190130A14a]|uniref:Antitoxin component YwqK of the YwqJK toxin-antitoxin module n=1 Tax=Tenacibaculum polynesiense TaxID=3137857 RepID=A0ABM9P7F0_9FLAO